MEAEKKARELVDKMLAVYDIDNIAIDCALIAVDEILSLHKKVALETLEFYLEVKQEIGKL
jgi:hypothetical protein